MAFKLLVLLCAVAAAQAGVVAPASYVAHPAPVAYAAAPVVHAAPAYAPIAKVAVAPVAKVAVEEFNPHPQYSFAYDVQDGLTGDSKNQQETRDGDVVHGSYSVVDPDGTKRTVEYTADDHNGFNAVVHKEPAAVKVVAPVAKIAAPVAYAAPVAKFAAPVAYTAPVAKFAAAPVAYTAPVVHAAPIAKIAAPVGYAAPLLHH